MLTKKELRAEIRRRKARYSREALDAFSAAIAERLLQHPRLTGTEGAVLLYHALPDEVDLNRLLTPQGTELLLPKVTGPDSMELRRYLSPEHLQTGAYGIQEPTGPLFADYDRITTAIMPGMAFDREGHRLGRGKGYYDRLLPQLKRAYKIGVCFPFQYFTSPIPTTETDVAMDEVIFG